jgi:hypothetical protein
MASHA